MRAEDVQSSVKRLHSLIDKNELRAAEDLFAKIKVDLTQLSSLPPILLYVEPDRANNWDKVCKELAVAREAMEAGTLLMVNMKDNEKFERNFVQLKAYYTDTRYDLLRG